MSTAPQPADVWLRRFYARAWLRALDILDYGQRIGAKGGGRWVSELLIVHAVVAVELAPLEGFKGAMCRVMIGAG